MRQVLCVIALFSLLVAAVPAAHAGTVVVVDTWSYDQFSESGTHTVYVDGQRVRVEFKAKEGETYAIYRLDNPDAPVMWIIDPQQRSYVELDKKAIKDAKNKMQEAMEMMENYMSNMSSEERVQIKKQYKKQIRQANKMMYYEDRMKKMKYEKVAEDVKIENWTCGEYKGMFKKELYKEVWVANWDNINLEQAEMAVFLGMSDVFGGFAGEMLPYTDTKVEKSDESISGFPVKTVFYEEGNKIVRQEVKEIRKEDFADTLFEIPEGFDKQDAM